MHSNIHGLTGNISELKYVIKWKKKPDFCLLSGIHVTKESQLNEFTLNSYNRLFCTSHLSHSGRVFVLIGRKIYSTKVSAHKIHFTFLLYSKWNKNTVLELFDYLFEDRISDNNDCFDNELEEMRCEKIWLYKVAQYSRDDLVWQNYELFKNTYKNKIKTKKYELTQRQLENVAGNMNGTYRKS